MDNLTNFKALFCRQFFPQLKQFIREFDLSRNKSNPAKDKDTLGMSFLLDSYNSSTLKDAAKYRDQCKWQNDIVGGDKELMLAIEEYFSITSETAPLQIQQQYLFEGLADPDNKATDNVIKAVFTDDKTLLAILAHFGIKVPDSDNTLEPQIQRFDGFVKNFFEPGNKKNYSLADFNKALHLFQQCRNDNVHNLRQQEVPQRKIALQFLAFVYIGLTYLLRMAWNEKGDWLVGHHYSRPRNFDMPAQDLNIVVRVKDSSNDKILKYDFVPNIKKGSERVTKEIDPTGILELTFQVKKYDKFKLGITYGNSDMQETKWFGDGKDSKIVSYYYWNPTFEVNLPSMSSIQPGLNVDNEKTQELIAQLLEDVNKRQDGLAKEMATDAVNKVLAELEPVLQKIQQLSESIKEDKKQNKSDKHKEERDRLIDNVNTVIQKHIEKSNENFEKILKRIDEIQDEGSRDLKKLETKVDGHYQNLRDEIQNLREETRKNWNEELTSDKAKFRKKHIWPVVFLFFSIGLFIYSFFHDLSLWWLDYRWIWIVSALGILGISAYIIDDAYKTTVSNRASIVSLRNKRISWGMVALTAAFMIATFVMIPHKTVSGFVANYDFFGQHDDGDNANAVVIMENYLCSDPADDETVRIQLAKYYLYISNNKERALNIVRPMIDNPDKYKKGDVAIAELYYALGNYRLVKKIIEKFKGNTDPVLDKLAGLMYIFPGGYDQNIMKGDSLLSTSARAGNVDALYWRGYLRSNNLSKFSTLHLRSGNVYSQGLMVYDLIDAACFYRQAVSHNHPRAAIELGNIYCDLNLNDSAEYYYRKAITLSDEENRKEASFKLGLLYEKQDIKPNDYMKEVEDIYPPAILYKARREKDHTSAIDYYKELGGYYSSNGYHRYIHPIVFEYIERNDDGLHDLECALDTLQATKPKGKFNVEFVRGMKCLLSKDSIVRNQGMAYMQESANKGCLYAKMLCLFDKWRNLIKEKDQMKINASMSFIKSGEKEMEEIAREIPFAYVLLSWLSKNMGNSNNAVSDYFAQLAIREGHPAGGLIITYTPESVIEAEIGKFITYDSYGGEKYRNDWSYNDFKNILMRRNCLEIALRTNVPHSILKNECITYALRTDKILTAINRNGHYPLLNSYPKERLRFWGDVAMANHDFHGECQVLNSYKVEEPTKKEDLLYKEKLIRAIFEDNYFEKDYLDDKMVIGVCEFLRDELRSLPSDVLKSLRTDYKNNDVAQALLNIGKTNGARFIPGRYGLNSVNFTLDNVGYLGLLNEFSGITEGLDKMVLDEKFKIKRDS